MEYQYDVYLSFTGGDRALKNEIRERFEAEGLSCYDSDAYCKGQFRENYVEALDSSRVYLMILTDNLRNDPAVSGRGTLSEVRKELTTALDLEAHNQLNIVILCMSEFFRYSEPFHDYRDAIGWMYYSNTRGFSMVYGSLESDGTLSAASFSDVYTRARDFIAARNAGTPIISQSPKLEISKERLAERGVFVGREKELRSVLDAFGNGNQVVVLTGLGGMGKTAIATEVARQCEEMGYLRCPQIVHIQELGGTRGALHSIVSSTSYERGVYDSLAYLDERDKYERKLKALRDLPENVLLVVDNYNSLTESDLRDLLSRLKCRILLTTRSKVDASFEKVECVTVGSLPEEEALSMFRDISKREITLDEFMPLYEYVGGHTITLCIIAKMMSVHGFEISEIIGKMVDDMDAEVEFAHNEYGDSDTVLGHLKKLFGISGFDEGCIRILRSMCILSNGTISVEDLMSTLSLKNKNEIIKLESSGWLEIRRYDKDFLYLHPILSHLMAKLLSPSTQNVSEMINYIIRGVDGARESLTYADAVILDERLFYAAYVIADASGRLPREVFDKFAAINRLLGDSDGTAKRLTRLSAELSDEEERGIVSAYSDMIIIEQHPTRVKVIEKYMANLEDHSHNYKWVMRALSLSLPHIVSTPGYEQPLDSILSAAFDAAMARRDDFAVMDLCSYVLFAKTRKAILKKIQRYVKSRRAEGETNGYLTMLDLASAGYNIFITKNMNPADILQKFSDFMQAMGSDNGFVILFYMLRYPTLLRKANKCFKEVEVLPEDDPMYYALNATFGIAERYVNDYEFDIREYASVLVNMHAQRLMNGTSLASASQAIAGPLAFMSSLPVPMVKREAQSLADNVDMNNIGVRALSNLQVSALMNSIIGDKTAIEQSRKVLLAVSKIRPAGHTDVLTAAMSYASVCATFGEDQLACDVYYDAYLQIKDNVDKSAIKSQIAYNIICSIPARNYEPEVLKELFECVACSCKETDFVLYNAVWWYCASLCDMLKNGKISRESEIFTDMCSGIRTLAAKSLRLPSVVGITAIKILNHAIKELAVIGEFDLAESFLPDITYLTQKCRRAIRRQGRTLLVDSEETINIEKLLKEKRGDGVYGKLIASAKRVIQSCLDSNSSFDIAHSRMKLMISAAGRMSDIDSSENIYFGNMISTEKFTRGPIEVFNSVMEYCFDYESSMLSDETKREFIYVMIDKLAADMKERGYQLESYMLYRMRSADDYVSKCLESILMTMYLKYHNDRFSIKPKTPAGAAPKEFRVRGHLIRPSGMPGRNDPCPCGSGKKYKACCFEKDRMAEENRGE